MHPWNSFVTAQQGILVRVQFDWQKTVHVDTVVVTLESVGTDRNAITVEVDGPWRKGPATLVIDRVVKNGETLSFPLSTAAYPGPSLCVSYSGRALGLPRSRRWRFLGIKEFRRRAGVERDDTAAFVAAARELNVTPHVTQSITAHRRSNIDGRTTQHAGYRVSQVVRKQIEEANG
jgi:hypothetical protein